MIFYHFCADRDKNNIMRHGLTIGGVAVPEGKGFQLYNGWIWLTCCGDATKQSWDTHRVIRYSRTAWRLSVDIPDSEKHRLYDRVSLRTKYGANVDLLFKGWDGSADWRVFHGMIPAEWIKAVERTGNK